MSGFAIRLDIQDGQAKAIVVDLRQRGENTTPVMKIIGEIGRTSIVKNFESEGRPTPWKKSKRALKDGGLTLTKSRRLAKSIVSKSSRDNVDIGTNVVYARIHNQGGDIKSPARERALRFGGIHPARMGENSVGPGRPTRSFASKRNAQFGMRVQGKAYIIRMPKREFMLLQPEDWIEIRDALTEYLAGR
jgi:phage gpG-like protein